MITATYNITPKNIDGFISSLATNSESQALLKNYIEDLSTYNNGGVPAVDISGSDYDDVGKAQVGIIEANSHEVVSVSHAAGFDILGNANVDFSKSETSSHASVPLNIIIGNGSNYVFLNNGADLVQGTTGNDTIVSDGGTDTLVAGSGASSIVGGGHSFIEGGSGSDTLVGGQVSGSRDTIYGGTGPDTITLGHGNNVVHGGSGPESITAGVGRDTIYGGTGPETINGGVTTTIYGGTGPETINGGSNNTIYGGGQSRITAGSQDTITLKGSDTLFGGSHASTIATLDNSSVSIQGGAGKLDVTLSNSASNDTIFGGTGGITVHVGEQYGQILSEKTDQKGVTTITFTNQQQLHVSHVTIEFPDGKHTQSF